MSKLQHRTAVNAAFLTVGVIYGAWAGRIPRLQTDRDFNERTLGLVLLCTAIGAMLAMPMSGAFIARRGSRLLTAIAFVALPFAAFGMTLSTGIWSAVLGFLVLGVVNGALDVAMNAQAVLVEEDYGRPILSSFHATFSIGMLVGALIAGLGAWMDVSVSWQMALVGVFGLVTALWAVGRLRPDAPGQVERGLSPNADTTPGGLSPNADTTLPSDRPALLRPELWALGAVAFCGMVGEGAMADWSTKYHRDEVGLAPQYAALALAAFTAAMTLGRLFGDRVRARWGDAQLLRRASFGALVSLGLVLAHPHPVLSSLGFAGVGLALSSIVPVVFSRAAKLPGLKAGVGISAVSSIGYAGFLVGPAAIGFLSQAFGLRPALLFVLALFGLMTAFSRQVKPLV